MMYTLMIYIMVASNGIHVALPIENGEIRKYETLELCESDGKYRTMILKEYAFYDSTDIDSQFLCRKENENI